MTLNSAFPGVITSLDWNLANHIPYSKEDSINLLLFSFGQET